MNKIPQRLHVVLRTCDKASISTDRIVPKPDCVRRCFRSLTSNLKNINHVSWTLTVFDDGSSVQTLDYMRKVAPMADIRHVHQSDSIETNVKKKSRLSVAAAYQHIWSLPHDDLVYVVEDDYLHYPNSLQIMLDAWLFFSSWLTDKHIGIFPQDFQQLHASPHHLFNDTYTRPCMTLIGPDRYYRTTWYTHETFLLQTNTFHQYRMYFDQLLTRGQDSTTWEGNTISQVWQEPDVCMLMPMPTIAIHVSQARDIPFYCNDFAALWQANSDA